MVWPTMSGMMVDRRDQVLMTFFSPLELSTSTFFNRWSSTNGPFFKLRGIRWSTLRLSPRAAGAAPADDHRIGLLVAGAGTALGLAPRGDRVTPTRGLPLTPTQGVVHRVHGYTPGLGALALPAVPSGLADLDQLGLGVPDHAQSGPAVDGDAAHLGRRQPQGGEDAFLGH